ncbi:MAG: hypothetical protein ABIQ73_20765 [Acidimicrobiales bacterium]
MKSKRLAKAGLALGLIGGTAAGFALGTPGISSAQTDTTTPSATASAATKPDRAAKLQETLKPLLDNGTLTQAQVDAVVAALNAAEPAGGHRGGSRGGGADLSVAATTIGVTAEELRTALQSGQSIADVATAKGVAPQAVIDAMVAAMNQRLAESVTAGKLTQAKADELAASAATRIADVVNGVAKPGRGLGARPDRAPTTEAPTTTTS